MKEPTGQRGAGGFAPATRVWKTRPADEQAARRLADALRVTAPVARLLASRGFGDPAEAERFLTPRLSDLADPLLLPNMDVAVRRIWKAVTGSEAIVVYGDYDVDGITSTALLVQVLESLGARVKPFLPLRMDEGYGLTPEGLQRCVDTHQPSLVVTVDCGTGSQAAVLQARAAGVDVVVTDHHAVAEGVAPALAVVNPKLGDERFHMLAGVGVTFKLCHALLKHGRAHAHGPAKELDLRARLDLVALGTITDIVPLVGENRILARHGLAQLNKTENLGLRTLIEVAKITQRIDTYEVGFRLGPRLNAAGRLGDALEALELLLTQDPARARELARRLDDSNQERQAVEAAIVQDVLRDLDGRFDAESHFGLVVGRKGWHPGVIGIVASRMVQRYNRPAVVIGFDEEGSGRGSCRSIEGFDLVGGLARCASRLKKYGGHAMAAGLEIDRTNLEAFQEDFNHVAAEALRGVDLRPVQHIDGWVALGDVDEQMFADLDQLRPFGHQHASPIWATAGVRVLGQPRIVGQKHLKLLLAGGGVQREAIAFGMAERPLPDGLLDVAFTLRKDTYQGRESLVLQVQDWRGHEHTVGRG